MAGGLPGPWVAVVDGDDNVWFSNFSSAGHSPLTELCGVRTETCPPGMKTGDEIGPPSGYGGGRVESGRSAISQNPPIFRLTGARIS
jgi:hypothetical protein